MLAVQKENLEMYKILLDKKDIDVNAQNKEGNTILHLASKIVNESFLNEILNNSKIDINIQNDQLNTPLHLVIENQNKTFAILLIKNEKCNLSLANMKKMTPLLIAFDKKLDEIVNLLLDIPRDININLKDEKGIFLLNHFFYMAFIHYVAKSYQYNILPSLFNRQDIDVNIKNSNDILIFCHYIMKLQ